jgi:hypothetical protein
MRLRFTLFIVCVGVQLASVDMVAWGNDAHRAVAQLAAERLAPAAQKAVAALLGPETLSDVALWADTVRTTTHPHTANWHFVNIRITSSGYNPAVHCKASPQGDCVIQALRRAEEELRDTTAPNREEPLRFMIHLVGDLHQPLHVGDNGDRGGNQRKISSIGGSSNLHSAWDTGIARASNRTVQGLVSAANAWLTTQDEAGIARG